MHRFAFRHWIVVGFGLATAACAVADLPKGAASAKRLQGDVTFFASKELEGRGITTRGIELAAEHIRGEFKKMGLKSGVADGSYYQQFKYGRNVKLDLERTRLALVGPHGPLSLKPAKDYQPIALGGTKAFNGPIVFAGYGITAERGYDDYSKIDAAGKVVLILRRNPYQQNADHPVFGGGGATRYNALTTKLQNALRHKAAAVLLVNDQRSVADSAGDKLIDVNYLGGDRSLDIPFAHVTQKIADALLADSALKSVQLAEAAIDKDGVQSQPLNGWTANGFFEFSAAGEKLHNVVAVLEGEGPTADETIVIGAHYDHVGYGAFGSLAPRELRGRIHPGADDNASGTSAMLETARRFAARSAPPRRRMVFIAFSAEESGLIGSKYYASQEPLLPLKNTVAMINFDMVGRLQKDELEIAGNKTAKEFEDLLSAANQKSHFKLKLGGAAIRGDSDHASFSDVGVPILFFFTGLHKDYHTPTDTADKINFEGIAKVVDFSEDVLDRLLAMPRPAFVTPPKGLFALLRGRSRRVWLGVAPQYDGLDKGLKVEEVVDDSPAKKGGVLAGDVIVDFNGKQIRNIEDLNVALEKYKPDDKVKVTLERGGQKKTVEVQLLIRPQ